MDKCGIKVFWGLILWSLTAILLTVLISGNILLYLAPRMIPMVWFALAVLAGLGVFQGVEIIRCLHARESAGKRWGLVLFAVPILFILTAAPNADTPGSLPNQTVNMLHLADAGAAGAAQSESVSTAPGTDASAVYPACVLMDETAFFDPGADLFSDYLQETVEALDGRTVTLYGFVYRDESFEDDTILVSRLMITCCAADASIVGFHVQVDPDIDLQVNEWIRVTGIVKTKSFLYFDMYYDFPVLTNGIILRCDTPPVEDAYVLP